MRLFQLGALDEHDEHERDYAFRTFAKGWRTAEPEPLRVTKRAWKA